MKHAIALCIAVTFSTSICAAETGASGANVPVTIPLDLSAVRPGVTLKIGDGPEWPAIMDTGSMKTIVNLNRAEEAGFTNDGPLEYPFNQMSASGYQTTIKSATINGLALPEISAPVIPLPLPDHVVIFSPSVFSGKLVTFNFAEAEMTLKDKTPGALPAGDEYSYSAPPLVLPTIPLTIETQTFDAHLDTGSGYGLIFPVAFADRLPLSEPLTDAGEAEGHSSKAKLFKSRIDGTVQVGPITVEDPEVLFTDVVPFANVGMKYLEQVLITLDPEEQRLWVEAL